MAGEPSRDMAGSTFLTSGMYIVDQHTAISCQAPIVNNWLHQQEIQADVDIIFLGDTEDENLDQFDDENNIRNPLQYLLEVYRKANLADNDRQLVLTHNDQLVALQLCMAQYNKQKFDDFDVDASEVLQLVHQLNNHKMNPSSSPAAFTTTQSTFESVQELYSKFCKRCNMVDILDVFHRVKAWFGDASQDDDMRKKCLYVFLRWPRNDLEVEIVKLLSTTRSYHQINIDNTDGNNHVRCEENVLDTLAPKKCELAPSQSSSSASEVLARQLFMSYLTLLVNSSDEISLARCLSLTMDELNHDGFTALKNEARAKNMPMFQTAVSYVTQIRLGGQSYRPKSDSPLAPHIKGLSEFVTAVQKLQTLVEEVPDTRTAVMKVISSVRSSLCQCKVQTLRKTSIDTVAEKLKKEMGALMGVWKGPLQESPPRKIDGGQGRIVYGLKTIRVLQGVLDREAGRVMTNKPIQALTDGFTSQKTPMRIPSLLSQFRSPEVIDPSSPEYQTLRSRLFSQKDATPAGPKRYQSDMTWAKPAVATSNDNNDDIEFFISPAQRQRKPASKGSSLWAVSPEGGSYRSRLISPNNDGVTNHGSSSNHLSTGNNFDCSDTPKKGKTVSRNLPKASTLDQENLVDEEVSSCRLVEKSKNRKPKRTLDTDGASSSQASKKAKKTSKVTKKKKVVPLGKGQKTLNQFFRV
ncbi:PCNA-interacting partner-like [Amphiura filiformis]|uniref:PCNA-interacting partner-like n=1 Tax=Amphiura filiformis TaxID=82378 RepID=UPI003B20FA99